MVIEKSIIHELPSSLGALGLSQYHQYQYRYYVLYMVFYSVLYIPSSTLLI